MNKFINNKIIVTILGILTIFTTLYFQQIDPIVCIALIISLLITETERVTFKNSTYILGIFVSFCLFPHNELLAFCVFEVSRLINKGIKNITIDLFSLVPVVALVFSFFQTRELMVFLYFAASFLLIFFDRILEKKDWASLTLVLYFIVSSKIITLLLMPWLIGIYLFYVLIDKAALGKNNFFNYICLSSIGLIALNFQIDKLFTYIVVSMMYTYISNGNTERAGIMNIIYMFTVLMFAKPYLTELTRFDNFYPSLIFLLPLFSLNYEKIYFLKEKAEYVSKIRTVLSLLVYILGVIAYAY